MIQPLTDKNIREVIDLAKQINHSLNNNNIYDNYNSDLIVKALLFHAMAEGCMTTGKHAGPVDKRIEFINSVISDYNEFFSDKPVDPEAEAIRRMQEKA